MIYDIFLFFRFIKEKRIMVFKRNTQNALISLGLIAETNNCFKLTLNHPLATGRTYATSADYDQPLPDHGLHCSLSSQHIF
jgi:hypothetical protein